MIRTDLYLADEVFMTGTAAEVTPVRAVDDVELGVGPVTLELQRRTSTSVNGRSERVEPLARRRRGARGRDGRRPGLSRGHASIAATTRSWSSSVERRAARQAEPALEEPRRDVAAERACEAKIGWRCIGFQSGRASMSSASSASRIASRSAPNAVGVDDDARQPARCPSRTRPPA